MIGCWDGQRDSAERRGEVSAWMRPVEWRMRRKVPWVRVRVRARVRVSVLGFGFGFGSG